jgi:hypothetical protein
MLEDLKLKPRNASCAVRKLLAKLDKKDQEILIAALANPDWGSLTLARELKARGLFISEHPIYRHRKGECSC